MTPLRDGMNLVAKEYVAAQNSGRSRRADPVALCRRRARVGAALVVNPYDHEGVAIAINRALSMPLEERRSAMR